MILTKEQRNAVKYDSDALIISCPGSGKTRTLAAKLIHCLDYVKESPRKIACITYTNAGVYEIENRLRQYGTTGDELYCEISTIHSFCLTNILQNFYWKIPEYHEGFSVLPPDSERYNEIASSICAEYGLPLALRENFELFNREPDGTPITAGRIAHEIALDFWNRLSKEKFIDFPNIIYYSYRILREHPSLAYALACRFAWFLIDEFQDTSALQIEILRFIAKNKKSKFFLVGDPYQSIYGFAGAHPELMETFAGEIGAKKEYALLTNFRSSENIISHAEILCPRDPPMEAGGASAKFPEQPHYVHSSSAIDAIISEFIPTAQDLDIPFGECAILAPWWVKLLFLGRELRKRGLPIFGPGSRPYRRAHLFASLAEQVCAYIESPCPTVFYRIENELFKLINNVTGGPNYKVYAFDGKKLVFQLIKCAKKLRDGCKNAIEWLERASRLFSEIIIGFEFLPASAANLLIESVEGIKQDMLSRRIDPTSLSIADLGMFANPDKNIKLLTMHRAKGREFDAVAIVDLHEGRVPHFSVTTDMEVEESRRLFYVSLTRARKLLMYITDEEDRRNVPSRFLTSEGLDVAT